jgi:hypothetical protein
MLERKINFVITKYCKSFPIEEKKLLSIWNNIHFFSTNEMYKELSNINLKKLKKNELINLCKKYNKNIGKSKIELINNLKLKDKEHFKNAFNSIMNHLSPVTTKMDEYNSVWDNMKINFSDIKYPELEYYKLISYNKDVLVSLCKSFEVEHTGKKNILIERLKDLSNIKVNTLIPVKLKSKEKKKQSIYVKKLKSRPTFILSEFRDSLYYIKNYKCNNKMFLFNKNKYIIKKYSNNQIKTLDKSDIIDCQIHNFLYVPPTNLDELIN